MNFSFKNFTNKSKFLKKLLAVLAIFSIGATTVEARSTKPPAKKERVVKQTKARAQKTGKVKVAKTRTPKVAKVKPIKARAPKVAKVKPLTKAQQKQAVIIQKQKAAALLLQQQQKQKTAALLLQQQQQAAALRQVAENQRIQAVAFQQQQVRQAEENQRQLAAAQLLLQRQEEARRIEEARLQTVRQQLQTFEQTHFIKTPRQRTNTAFIPENYELCDLGFTGRARSEQYQLNLPTAPILHPYNPIDNATERNYTSPAYSLNLKLPGYDPAFVPEALHRNLTDINPNNISVFVEVQDGSWLPGTQVLLRPQSWLDPEAPFQSPTVYNRSFTVKAGLFSDMLGGGPVIQGQPPQGLLDEPGISTHNSVNPADGTGDQQVISSGATLPIINLDLDTTTVFYSLTKHGDRAAVVKHVFLNPQDQTVFEGVLGRSNNLRELRHNMRQPGLVWSRNLDDLDF